MAGCFTEDARAVYSGVALATGRAAIVAHLQGLRTLIASTHIMGLPAIDLDGDRAHAETSGIAYLVTPTADGPLVRTRGLRYADDFALTGGRWLIERRVHRCDWMYETPLTPTTIVVPPTP